MIPLGNVLFQLYLLAIQTQTTRAEQKIKSLLCTLPRANEDLGNTSWVDKFCSAYQMRRCALDLLHAIDGELELSGAGVSAVLGPFCLAWVRVLEA
jgi:hypothetical protein